MKEAACTALVTDVFPVRAGIVILFRELKMC